MLRGLTRKHIGLGWLIHERQCCRQLSFSQFSNLSLKCLVPHERHLGFVGIYEDLGFNVYVCRRASIPRQTGGRKFGETQAKLEFKRIL